MSDRIRVVYWNSIPSPYFVERLTALSAIDHLDVHGIFNSERNADRSWNVDPETWGFDGHWADRTRVGLYDASRLVKSLRPDLLVSLYGEPSFAINGPRSALHSRRWAIRVVPTFDAWESRHPLKEATKKALGRIVDGAKVPGPDGRAYAARMGVSPGRICEVQQSVPVEHFRSGGTRSTARHRLGIPESEFVFVYVGRLWEGKGLGTLLEASQRVSSSRPWSLLVVGDGPMEGDLRRRDDLPLRLTGFVQRPELPAVLAAADCLVFPTMGDPFGLVVEECMAAGMPVIASDQMGDARRRVEDTDAGLIVSEPTGPAWAFAMDRMLHREAHERWRVGAVRAAQHVGHDAYVRDFLAFTESMLALPPRRPHLRRSVGVAGR
ncbi:MAG: glycosyltransferase [Nocardioides sp.]|uniref:glycosyltransferase n=1 Tax=Nocardioides sp. TaxID=35761 RepID=UPI002395A39C|nr:glycosyltransferase [Nocardioides sp.]MDE0776518.1 glycosyltransferase [Nocardioides sp.]